MNRRQRRQAARAGGDAALRATFEETLRAELRPICLVAIDPGRQEGEAPFWVIVVKDGEKTLTLKAPRGEPGQIAEKVRETFEREERRVVRDAAPTFVREPLVREPAPPPILAPEPPPAPPPILPDGPLSTARLEAFRTNSAAKEVEEALAPFDEGSDEERQALRIVTEQGTEAQRRYAAAVLGRLG